MPTDEPLWKGAATVAMARRVYGIKTPEEFREPSLFDLLDTNNAEAYSGRS
jgi:hypothetical protein